MSCYCHCFVYVLNHSWKNILLSGSSFEVIRAIPFPTICHWDDMSWLQQLLTWKSNQTKVFNIFFSCLIIKFNIWKKRKPKATWQATFSQIHVKRNFDMSCFCCWCNDCWDCSDKPRGFLLIEFLLVKWGTGILEDLDFILDQSFRGWHQKDTKMGF